MNFRHNILILTLLCTSLACASCGPIEVQGDIRQVTVNIEEFVYRPVKPQVYVHAQDYPARELTAIMIPFRMQQSMRNPDHYGREVARIFWQKWLQNKIFPVFEFMEHTKWRGGNAAVAAARAKGADLAVGGVITHFVSGGTLGDSQIALKVEIYDAHSGALIWSMAHSGLMKQRGTQDYILFRTKSQLPADPMYAISMAIAHDMSGPIKNWIKKGKELQEEMNQPCEGDECPKQEKLY